MSTTPPADNSQALACPRCAQAMRQVRTPERVLVSSCLPCRGMWVDPESGAEAAWVLDLPQADASEPTQLGCPRCATALEDLLYRIDQKELHVNWCGGCRGIWVEQGVLGPLRAFVDACRAQQPAAEGEPAPEGAGAEAPVEGAVPEAAAGAAPAAASQQRLIMAGAAAVAVLVVLYFGLSYLFVGGAIPVDKEISAEPQVGRPTTSGPIIDATKALGRFFQEQGRWPRDSEELKPFADQKQLSFDPEKFAKIAWRPLPGGDLRVDYEQNSPPDIGIIEVSKPAAKPAPAAAAPAANPR